MSDRRKVTGPVAAGLDAEPIVPLDDAVRDVIVSVLRDPSGLPQAQTYFTSPAHLETQPNLELWTAIEACGPRGGVENVLEAMRSAGTLTTAAERRVRALMKSTPHETLPNLLVRYRRSYNARAKPKRERETGTFELPAFPGERRHSSANVRRVVVPAAPEPDDSWFIDVVDRALGVGYDGPRFATGFPTLDKITAGGLRPRDRVFVAGAPDSGKTTFVLNAAVNCVRAGMHVAFLASDEHADSILVRIGQDFGGDALTRARLDGGDKDARQELARRLTEDGFHERFLLADCGDGATVEGVVERLLERSQGAPAALFVDSLQTVRALGTDEARDDRERVNAATAAIKNAARAHNLVVWATSEAPRSWYRSRDPAQQCSAMSAFKHSGNVEFAGTLLLAMRPAPDSEGASDVEVAKNKVGVGKPTFRLSLDVEHVRFLETTRPEDPDPDERRAAAVRVSNDRLRAKVLATVRKHPGLTSKNQIFAACEGAKRGPLLLAVDACLLDGSLVRDAGGAFRVAPGATDSHDN